ncbi:ephrin-B2-like isoform X1 [Branchiostoma lanceolatum]|uniref:ephrin-B2-like isoform X1 n=1 Tax=Branchiostoma lanceolatum TaxID=7740 RepID=UPI0034557718
MTVVSDIITPRILPAPRTPHTAIQPASSKPCARCVLSSTTSKDAMSDSRRLRIYLPGWILLLLALVTPALGRGFSFYWDQLSPSFQREGGHVLEVDIGDKLNIICPRLFSQFNTMYEVFSREEYETCNSTRGRLLLRCDLPDQDLSLTILFQEVSPSPFGLEFEKGKDYYYIATSSGTMDTLDNRLGGNCQSPTYMKLTIRVRGDPTERSDSTGGNPPGREDGGVTTLPSVAKSADRRANSATHLRRNALDFVTLLLTALLATVYGMLRL